jgi:hypothetical protein
MSATETLPVHKSFRMTREEADAIRKIAAEEGRKEADVIRRIFRRGLVYFTPKGKRP